MYPKTGKAGSIVTVTAITPLLQYLVPCKIIQLTLQTFSKDVFGKSENLSKLLRKLPNSAFVVLFKTPNFFSVENNGWAAGFPDPSPKLAHSRNWCLDASDIIKFLKFCFGANCLK